MPLSDPFAGTKNKRALGSASPPLVWAGISKSDSDLTTALRVIRVYGTGDIKLRNAADDSDVTFTAVPANWEITGCFSRVWSTGTTASSIYGAT